MYTYSSHLVDTSVLYTDRLKLKFRVLNVLSNVLLVQVRQYLSTSVLSVWFCQVFKFSLILPLQTWRFNMRPQGQLGHPRQVGNAHQVGRLEAAWREGRVVIGWSWVNLSW